MAPFAFSRRWRSWPRLPRRRRGVCPLSTAPADRPFAGLRAAPSTPLPPEVAKGMKALPATSHASMKVSTMRGFHIPPDRGSRGRRCRTCPFPAVPRRWRDGRWGRSSPRRSGSSCSSSRGRRRCRAAAGGSRKDPRPRRRRSLSLRGRVTPLAEKKATRILAFIKTLLWAQSRSCSDIVSAYTLYHRSDTASICFRVKCAQKNARAVRAGAFPRRLLRGTLRRRHGDGEGVGVEEVFARRKRRR